MQHAGRLVHDDLELSDEAMVEDFHYGDETIVGIFPHIPEIRAAKSQVVGWCRRKWLLCALVVVIVLILVLTVVLKSMSSSSVPVMSGLEGAPEANVTYCPSPDLPLCGLEVLPETNVTSCPWPDLPLCDAYANFKGQHNGGTIPTEIGEWTHLEHLDLDDNDLTGTVPTEIGLLSSNLTYFDLAHNVKLVGTLPTEVGQLTSLKFLFLYETGLSGTIPTELGLLTNLRFLGLSGNNFTGSIPETMQNLTGLTQLWLHANPQLTGTMPLELLSKLTSMVDIRLYDTSLTGNISAETCALGINDIEIDCDITECPASCCRPPGSNTLYCDGI